MISGMMWGVVLLLIGLCLIIKTLFGISIPLMRIGVGILLTYAGITLLTNPGSSLNNEKKSITFAQETLLVDNPLRAYDIIFGQGQLDFSHIRLAPGEAKKITINTILGINTLKINPLIPTKIVAQVTAGSVRFPDAMSLSFGTHTYQTRKNQIPQLEIHTQTIMGSLNIETN